MVNSINFIKSNIHLSWIVSFSSHIKLKNLIFKTLICKTRMNKENSFNHLLKIMQKLEKTHEKTWIKQFWVKWLTDRQMHRQVSRSKSRQTNRNTDKNIDRLQTDRQSGRKEGRQAGRWYFHRVPSKKMVLPRLWYIFSLNKCTKN